MKGQREALSARPATTFASRQQRDSKPRLLRLLRHPSVTSVTSVTSCTVSWLVVGGSGAAHLGFLDVVGWGEHRSSRRDEIRRDAGGNAVLLEGRRRLDAHVARHGLVEEQAPHQTVAMRLEFSLGRGLRLPRRSVARSHSMVAAEFAAAGHALAAAGEDGAWRERTRQWSGATAAAAVDSRSNAAFLSQPYIPRRPIHPSTITTTSTTPAAPCITFTLPASPSSRSPRRPQPSTAPLSGRRRLTSCSWAPSKSPAAATWGAN